LTFLPAGSHNGTMKKVGGIDIETARAFLAEKEQKRMEALHSRWEAAEKDFERIVCHVISTYNPRGIYQWGSLLNFKNFSEISDIDIALEGLSGPEEYFAILGDAMKMTDFPLDIIELEKLDQETADNIRNKGRLVYERKNG
jgi:hypothetical protein